MASQGASGEDPIESRYCGNCKQQIAAANFQLHEMHCQRHLVLCKKCNEPVPRNSLKEHEEEEHKDVECDFCRRHVPLDKLEKHKEDCTHRPVNCPYCELEYPHCDYTPHEEACGSRTEECHKCAQKVMLRDLLKHESSNCKSHSTEQQQQQPRQRSPPNRSHRAIEEMMGIRPNPIEELMMRQRRPPPSMPYLPKINNSEAASRRSQRPPATRTGQSNRLTAGSSNVPTSNRRTSNTSSRSTTGNAGPATNETVMSGDITNEPSIPCEFCDIQVPLHMFEDHMTECNQAGGAVYHPPHRGPDYFNHPEPITEPNIPFGMGLHDFGSRRNGNLITETFNPPTTQHHIEDEDTEYKICELCEFPIEEGDYPVHFEICQMEQLNMLQAVEQSNGRDTTEFHTYNPLNNNITANNNSGQSSLSPTRNEFRSLGLCDEEDRQLPASEPIVTFDEEESLIPCEHCCEMFPPDSLTQHEYNCDANITRTMTPFPTDSVLMGSVPGRPKPASRARANPSSNSITSSSRTKVVKRTAASSGTASNGSSGSYRNGATNNTRYRGLEGSMNSTNQGQSKR